MTAKDDPRDRETDAKRFGLLVKIPLDYMVKLWKKIFGKESKEE